MKLLKLKVPNCASCLYSDIQWLRFDGDTVYCNAVKEEGQPKKVGRVGDGQEIPEWCPLEDVKE